MKDNYTKRCHSVTKITYHAVFVIKYRRKVLNNDILKFMKEHTKYLIENCYKGKLIDFNGEEDHVHILFEIPPSLAPATTICNLKTQLSKEIRKRYYNEIKDKLWNNTFWSNSYFLTTTGGSSIETLKKYIEEQGIEKPKRKYVFHIKRY